MAKSLKLLPLLAALAYLTYAQDEEAEEEEDENYVGPSQACMYCRKMDRSAGWLQSFSYCQGDEECIMDAWNYIKRKCTDGWKRGDSYALEFCNAETIVCPDFKSTPDLYGNYDNKSWSIAAGGQCVVKVDAT